MRRRPKGHPEQRSLRAMPAVDKNGHMTKTSPNLPLTDGSEIPAIGVGTWPLDDAEVREMCLTAFEIGYRLVDTAENYRNEAGVGRAVRESGLPRGEVFVTTKFNRKWHGDAVGGVSRNLERLGWSVPISSSSTGPTRTRTCTCARGRGSSRRGRRA